MAAQTPLTGAQRVAKRRAALRAQGLKPRTIWVPAVSAEEFRRRAQRDVRLINAMRSRQDDIDYIQAIQYTPEDDYDWGPEGPP